MAEVDPEPSRRRARWAISRERAIELAVVVFGVLVALALENVAQEFRWRSEARELERLFREDIRHNVASAIERQAVDPCLRQQLASLAKSTAQARRSRSASAYSTQLDHVFAPTVAEAYRAPVRNWLTTSFEHAQGSEAAKRIPPERLLAWGGLFSNVAVLQDLQQEEYLAGATLAPLAYDQPDFNGEARAQALQDIARVDRLRGRLTALALQMVERGKRADLGLNLATAREASIADEQRTLAQTLQVQRVGRGACVDIEGALSLLPAAP